MNSQHLCSVDQSYFEHLFIAWRMSAQSIFGGWLLYMHGLVPDIFVSYAGNLLMKVADDIKQQRNNTCKTK